MKAAIYCRYSSRAQREASLEDQARNCRRIAEREGFEVGETYGDAAISGSRSDRPAYQRMLTDAKARRFDVLLVDDLSRLGRDQVESETTHRRLEHWGLRVIGASDGYDSTSKGRKVTRAVRGLMSEIYLDDLADKTHYGQEGQARAGYWCGSRPYGYALVAEWDPVKRDAHGQRVRIGTRLEVDPEQSTVVVRIYEAYANGKSPRAIAAALNAERIAPPGARWNRAASAGRAPVWLASAIYGNPKLGTGILRNVLYTGCAVWNKSKWVKDPETKRRGYHLRDASEHVERAAPELRIVSDELWQRVQARHAEKHAASANIRAALHANARTGRSPKYLLSGLLTCSKCGGRFVASGSGRSAAYACATRVNGGASACDNVLRVPRRVAETYLLEGLRDELAAPARLETFKREVRRLLESERNSLRDQDRERVSRLAQLDTEIGNLADAIASGALRASPAIGARLQTAESERATLAAGTQARTAKIADFLPRIASDYASLVAELETALQRDVDRARHNLRTLLGPVRLRPDETGKFLIAEGEMQTAQLLNVAGPLVRKCGSGGRI